MKRITHLLFVVLVALTLSACAAATNPVLDQEAAVGAYADGP